MSVLPGQRFGSYEIAASIGAGGMGEVFRAKDTNLKRDVALKFLPKAFLEDQDRLARFRREAEMLAALNHSNIAQVYGLEKADGQTAIVMELVEGPTLADLIKDGPIPPDEAMAIALQVVAALEAAHEKGIVHRDLKPANVKVREDGAVKVLDFGISKPVDPKLISGGTPIATTPAMTQTGIILGTAAYMSPEQARGRFVDERTDIWAFGCLMFEMLTGQPAFGGEDMMAVLARVIDRDTDMNSMPKAISPAVRQTIRLCLQKDPRKRIADVRDVRLALEGRFESEMPRSVEETKSARQLWRRVLMQGTTLLAGAASAALIALALWPGPRATPQPSRWTYAVPAALRPAFETNVPVLAVALDGSEYSYASIAGLVRHPLDEFDGRLIPGTGPRDRLAPHYSGDSRSLYYSLDEGLEQRSLKRIDVEGGTSETILRTYPGNGWWPTADGELYGALYDDRCVIARIPLDGGEPDPVFEDKGIACFEPALMPGGKYFLSFGFDVTEAQPAGYILIHSIESQQTKKLFAGIQSTLVDGRWLAYYEPGAGLSVRTFDAQNAFDEGSQAFSQPVLLVDDLLAIEDGVAHYRVSPGGETLVYVKRPAAIGPDQVLARLRPDGALERFPFAGAAGIGMLSVSPVGLSVALSRYIDAEESYLLMYDLTEETEPRQLSIDGFSDAPSFAPGGDYLVFTSTGSGGPARIWRQDLTGSRQAEELTSPEAGFSDLYPVVAPDGTVGFSRRAGELEYDLYTITPPSRTPELLRGGPGPQIGLDFSPDGKAYSYQSGERVLVERYPPDNSPPLLVGEAPTLSAWSVWSSDSRRLAYWSGSDEVTIVEIDTDSLSIRKRNLPLTVPTAGNGYRMLDALPDSDDWLVVVAADASSGQAGPAAEIVVVQNWIEEIRRRAPAP